MDVRNATGCVGLLQRISTALESVPNTSAPSRSFPPPELPSQLLFSKSPEVDLSFPFPTDYSPELVCLQNVWLILLYFLFFIVLPMCTWLQVHHNSAFAIVFGEWILRIPLRHLLMNFLQTDPKCFEKSYRSQT